MADVYRALGGPWSLAAEAEDAEPEPRQVLANVICRHESPVEHSVYDEPCGWAGVTFVNLWDESKEALWVCPKEHENSEPWTDFA